MRNLLSILAVTMAVAVQAQAPLAPPARNFYLSFDIYGDLRLRSGDPDPGDVLTAIDTFGTMEWAPPAGGGGGSSNWQVNSGSITPLTATKLVMRDGATTTTNKLFDFRIPSNVVTANADTVGVIGWSSDGTAAEKRDIIFKSAAVSFRGPNPSFRINSTASDPNVTGGSFVQERNGALQHYIQSERADLVRWNFYNGANASKLGIAGWHANFGIAIGQYTTSNLAENDLMLLTRGVIGEQRKGVLFSPHTAAEMAAFTPTTEGTMVYNTTDNCYHLWDGAAWKSMCDTGGSLWTAAGSNAYYNTGKIFIGPGTPAYPGILNLRGVGNDEATDVLYVTNLANDFVFSVRESKFVALSGNQPTLVLNHIPGTTTGVTSAINFKYNNTTRGFLGLEDQEMVISSIGLGDVHVGANSLVVDDGGLRVVGALAAQDWFGVVPNEGRVYVGSAPGTATAFTVQTPPGTRVGAAVAVDNITIAGDRTGMIVENSGSHTGDNYGIKITVDNPGTGASIPMRIEQPGTVAGSYLVATNVGGDMALRVRPYAYFGSAPGTTPIHTLPNADVTDGWVDFLTTADPGDFGAVNYSSEMTISSTGRVTYNGAQPRRFLCSWTVNVGGDYSAGPSSIAELASLLNGTTINDQSRALAYVHNNTGPHIAHSEFIVELTPGDYIDPVIKVYSEATTNTLDIYSWHFTITTAD